MVKALMAKKPEDGGKPGKAAPRAEIRAVIQEAIDLLGIKPERRESFAPLAAEVGVASSTLYGAYRGDHGLGPGSLQSVRQFVLRKTEDLSRPATVFLSPAIRGTNLPRDIMRDVQITVPRYIPVLTLAQGGNVLVAWENLPMHFTEKVPCDLADPQAFAIRVQGNSMEPHFREGDRLIVSPSEELHNGDIVVARFTNGDTMLKLYHEVENSGEIQLASYNPEYPPKMYKRSEFEAIVVVVQRVQDVSLSRIRRQF